MLFVFFNDTATTEIYTLSLHDALPIYRAGTGLPSRGEPGVGRPRRQGVSRSGQDVLVARAPGADHPSSPRTPQRSDGVRGQGSEPNPQRRARQAVATGSARPGLTSIDRKSTRLNSSHANISYAV